MASGRVWVLPGMLAAKVMTAPNSPSAVAKAMTIPARKPGPASGKATEKKRSHGAARSAPAQQHQQDKTDQHRRQDDGKMGDGVQHQLAGKARPRQSKGGGNGEGSRPQHRIGRHPE